MDPLSSPPGWRTELGWGAAALCLLMVPALPLLWVVGRCISATNE